VISKREPASPKKPHCPLCGKPFDPKRSPAMPFCSERCRLIDLGRWLGEDYGVPHESLLDEEAEEK
jgi:endogenous inhibitor of DNA gyrase (YacG/DUF329 family)